MIHYLFAFITAVSAMFPQNNKKTVVFVCEHGSAKSIVSAAWFRKIAAKEGLDVRTVSRGTNPDKVVPEKINELLAGDGFERHSANPEKLTEDDIKNADYVVTFTSLPANFAKPARVESWNVPSFEGGYPVARDSIITNVQRLVNKIKSNTRK